jgi:hypothetical protein
VRQGEAEEKAAARRGLISDLAQLRGLFFARDVWAGSGIRDCFRFFSGSDPSMT